MHFFHFSLIYYYEKVSNRLYKHRNSCISQNTPFFLYEFDHLTIEIIIYFLYIKMHKNDNYYIQMNNFIYLKKKEKQFSNINIIK